MKHILNRNLKYLQEKKIYFSHKDKIETALHALNKEKIIIVSGVRHAGKTKFLADFLQKTGKQKETFYYNHDLDMLGEISERKHLEDILQVFEKDYGNPKIIALQNCSKIEGIKTFIQDIYKQKKYKIILVGNNIQIEWVTDIEIFPLSFALSREEKIENFLHFGGFEEVHLVRDTAFRRFVLESLKNDIISGNIMETYNIKNRDSFVKMLVFLGLNGTYITQRELQRELSKNGIDISLITMMEYLSAALNSKILKKMYQFDIKKNKEIQTQIKYYFSDVGFRHALTYGEWKEQFQRENMLYNELLQKWYEIYGMVNGRFEMNFSARKGKRTLNLHFHYSNEKNELKKDAHKMEKLWNHGENILIVSDISLYHLRTPEIDGVRVMELSELLKII